MKPLLSPHVLDLQGPMHQFPIPETISFFLNEVKCVLVEMRLDYAFPGWEWPIGAELRTHRTGSIWKWERWGSVAILVMISTTGDWTEPRFGLCPANMAAAKT